MRKAALGGVLVLALSACTMPWSGPAPEPVAERAARQLSAGKPGDAFDQASKELFSSVVHLGAKPQVKVTGVETQDQIALASLTWTWPLGKGWTYDTKVGLKRSGDTWVATLTPSTIQPDLRQGETLERTTLRAARGRILGADGRVIVEPRKVLRIGIDKATLKPGQDAATSARTLGGWLKIDAKSYADRVVKAGPKAFVEAIVVRPDDPLAKVVQGSHPDLPGLRVLSDHLPLTPTRDFAPGLIGTVGPATAEAIEASRGRLVAGDDTGLSGLQKRYDDKLAGLNGVKVVKAALIDDSQRTTLFESPPTPGVDITLSLDLALQQKAVGLLRPIKPASSLVAIRPSTGEILAAASGPGAKGINIATFGKAAPGSTFKIVSALGLLRSGLTPTSPVDCPATTSVNGKSFKNYSDYPASSLGRITLAEAVAQSCNTAFIGNHRKLTPAVERDAAAALGFGVDHDTGFPAYFGSIPAPASDTEAAADLIGQGRVQASAMSMATVLASVAAGEAVVPKLVEGAEISQKAPSKPLTRAEATHLRAMLRGVVANGSGRGLQGVADMAKTGTAEYGDAGDTHAWMVAAKGDLAVAVYVETGESGSRTAGPILKQFLSR